MSNNNTEVCPNYKGKGHVLDAMTTIMIPVLGWILAPFETNSPDGFTREECSFCDGRGRVDIDR